MAAEAEPQPEETQPRAEQPTEAPPTPVMEAFAQAPEDAQAAGEPVAEIATAMADGEIIKAEIIENAGAGQLIVITAEPEATEAPESPESMPEAVETTAEAEAQPEDSEQVKKSTRKSKGKKGAAATEGEGK